MGWYEAFKDSLKLAQQSDNIELTRQLLEIQREVQELQQENFELKNELSRLTERQSKKIEYNEKRTALYEIKEDGTKDGPYCTACWEKNGQLISVHTYEHGTQTRQGCPVCKNEIVLERTKKQLAFY